MANITFHLPALPITRHYFPAKEQSTPLKIMKLAGFIPALPFLLIADLFPPLHRQPVPVAENYIPPQLSTPKPTLSKSLPKARSPLPPKRVIQPIPQNRNRTLSNSKISSLIPKITLAALGCAGLAVLGYAAYRAIQNDASPQEPDGVIEEADCGKDLQSSGLLPVPIILVEPQDPHLDVSAVAKERFSMGQCLKRTCDTNIMISHCWTPKIPVQSASPLLLTANPTPIPTSILRLQNDDSPDFSPLGWGLIWIYCYWASRFN